MIKHELRNKIVYLDFAKHDDGILQDYYFDLYSEEKSMLLECWVRFFPDNKHMELKTITAMRGKNKGYGSFVMKKVIELAIQLEAPYITGFISPLDTGTKELKSQVHGFYKKHFAEIRESSFFIDLKKQSNILELLEIQFLQKELVKVEEEKESLLKKNERLLETIDSLLKKKRTEKRITTIFKKIVSDNS